MRESPQTIKRSKRLFITTMASLVMGAGLIMAPIGTPAANAISVGGPSDCDNNAVIKCGAHSTGALLNAYQSSAYVRGVYAYFGISQGDMANLQVTNVAGHVNKDGKVYVDNRSNPVATGAVTGGRQDIPGSRKANHGGAIFYVRPPSVSFQQPSLPAFVAMKNGQFQFAIIASCGNAVRAAAVKQTPSSVGQAKPISKPQAKKPSPKPAPAPALSQSQSQSQSQSVNVTSVNTNTVNNTQTTAAAQPAPAQTEQPTQIETSSQPTSLVNTGPSGVVGLFVIASAAGTFFFRRFILHRLADY